MDISFFNNFNFALENGSRPSSGLEFRLSLPPNKTQSPQLLKFASDPEQPIYADSQGSTELLENGRIFMDYGQIAVMKEYGAASPNAGTAKWTARFGRDNAVQLYRGFKQKWSATPYYSPDLVLKRAHGECAIGYVSWNGATNVTAWEIWAGSGYNHSSFHRVGKVAPHGFETVFSVRERCAQAVAFEGEKVAGKSLVACAN